MTDANWIVLARHGRVSVPLRARIAGNQFAAFVDELQTCGIAAEFGPPSETCALSKTAGILVSSDLRRSVESAQLLTSASPTLSESVFREAEVPTMFRCSIALRCSTWIVLARLLWHVRSWAGVESPPAARARAAVAVSLLESLAEQHGSVFLVGHGYFNRFIAAELRRRHWKGARFPATGNWATSRYWRPATVAVSPDQYT
jgi:hypothetical protein